MALSCKLRLARFSAMLKFQDMAECGNILRQHEIFKEAETIQCPVCNKHFKEKSGLKVHTVVHTKERNNECSLCGKFFGLKGNLQHHEERVHKKEGLNHCEICKINLPTKIMSASIPRRIHLNALNVTNNFHFQGN